MKIQPTSAELRAALDKKEAARGSRFVHFIASSKGYLPVDPPQMAKEISCPFCGCTDFLLWADKEKTVWFCERICTGSMLPKSSGSMDVPPTPKRALLWPLFCEINGIGDVNHEVRFENVQQSEKRVAFMLQFVGNPRGILLMQGNRGSGKTYSALAMCELFTRKSTSCVFSTQKQMLNQWLDTFKQEQLNEYVKKITEIQLLVIDDFGIGDPTVAFMAFFMELINTRLQWTNRGTVITTNLSELEMNKLCGPALMDRINTGQTFLFEEKQSRRKPTYI